MQENPVLVLFDLCRHFEQGQDHGPALGRSEGRVARVCVRRAWWGIGGAGEQGRVALATTLCRGAVTVEVTLDRLDGVFAFPRAQ